MNLKLPISTAQMIFKRCWETGGGESQQLLLPEEQQKSCHALQNKGLDSILGRLVLAWEPFVNRNASWLQHPEMGKFGI